MKALLLNPYAWLIAVAVLLLAVGGGYWWGHTAAATACAAQGGRKAAKVESVEDRRDEHIDAIATAAATAAAAAVANNQADTHESSARIRTITVAGPCRDVPAPVLRELQDGADAANAALGIGVRSGSAGTGTADSR